jgi:hypothetical protein
MDRRLKKEVETAKPKPTMRGLLAKSEDKMPARQSNIQEPMDRVASYMTMIRDKKEAKA